MTLTDLRPYSAASTMLLAEAMTSLMFPSVTPQVRSWLMMSTVGEPRMMVWNSPLASSGAWGCGALLSYWLE